jgi:hypothetical protein
LLDPTTIRDLGFQYYSIGRPQPKAIGNGDSELITPIKFKTSSENAGGQPRDEVTHGTG